MSNVLKIKSRQSGSAGAPASLARAELAYNEQDDTIYIGHGSGTDSSRTKKAIGGVGAFVDKASSQVVTNKDLTATSNSFTAATATQSGVVELATDAETNTGTDQYRAVTPANIGAFTGTTNITTVGTISSGTWSGTALVAGKVPNLEGLNVGGNLSMGSNRITNLAAPVAANDAARKSDIDSAIQGLDVRDSVRLHLASPSANKTGTPTIDGVQCSANMFFFVEEGTSYADTGWVCTTNEDVTLANLAFSQFSGTGSITAGDGLDKSGSTLSVDLKANGGIVIESTEMAVDLGASSITGTLAIADGGTGRTDGTLQNFTIDCGTF